MVLFPPPRSIAETYPRFAAPLEFRWSDDCTRRHCFLPPEVGSLCVRGHVHLAALLGRWTPKQSRYDTFATMAVVRLKALQRYSSDSIGAHSWCLETQPRAGLEALLMQSAHAHTSTRKPAPLPGHIGIARSAARAGSRFLTETMGRC